MGGLSMTYPKLRGAIRERYPSQEAFALDIGISPSALSCKLNGKTEWVRNEIIRACDALEIPLTSVHTYFFMGDKGR